MGLSEDIKAAIAPYIGQDLSPATINSLKSAIFEVAYLYGYGTEQNTSIDVLLGQTQAYLTLKIMTDNYQQQIDELKARTAALEVRSTEFAAAIANLQIGTNVQAWNKDLQAIADLTLGINQLLGTDGEGNITQYAKEQGGGGGQTRLVGSVLLLPYDPASLAAWKIDSVNNALYSDPAGWYWYHPNGTALSNAKSQFRELYLSLWGTASYLVTGGKGANALADWEAGKVLNVPDMRGRAAASSGTPTVTGGTNRLPGATWGGAETVTLAIANLPAHAHNVSVTNITASNIAGLASSGLGVISNGLASVSTIQSGTGGVGIVGNRVTNNDGLGAIATTGTGTPFSILNPAHSFFELWWLNVHA